MMPATIKKIERVAVLMHKRRKQNAALICEILSSFFCPLNFFPHSRLFLFGMFLTFENIMYFICSIGLFFWLNNFVIYEEEKYLKDKFGDEFERYCNSVKRWILF